MPFDHSLCRQHQALFSQVACLQTKCKTLENRLWTIVLLLIGNLAGIVGVLINVLK